MIITTGRETGRYSEKPLVRTLGLSPHQANHGYLTRLLPGLFLPVEKYWPDQVMMPHADHRDAGDQAHKRLPLQFSRASKEQAKYPQRQALVPGGQDGHFIFVSI
ncbi:hypothetical protein [Pseudomonas sp. GM55]|uniref:hypothetical protein n=1 Tax=Pseudomonas sp. GM55 TaxID=1144333 RepID=UPI0012FCAF53|nr:hypothetical protein [Pseudomonas sp. GM55]